jgi:murein DD-endopeptidase MepM/ murein hydrolase activator NlpD
MTALTKLRRSIFMTLPIFPPAMRQIILLALLAGLPSVRAQVVQLSFPLNSGQFTNPWTAPITSIFDHSMSARYSSNGIAVAYTGEVGDIPDPNDTPVVSGTQLLYSFKKADSSAFVINGHYVGTSTTHASTLNYDGHPGYDYPVGIGAQVYAAADGVVVTAFLNPANDNPAGKYIQIEHTGTSYLSQYEHLSQLYVTNSQTVQRGDLIGLSGNSGGVSAHLHFETKMNVAGTWRSVDPYGWQGVGADPYTLATNILLWANNSYAGEVITNVMSPVVSYQYYDALGADTNSPIISPVASYQFFDALGMDTNSPIYSLMVSYQYPDLHLVQGYSSGSSYVVWWPVSTTNATLETSTNMISWTTVTDAPAIVNLQNTVTNSMSDGARYFRFKK